ncbi:MAG: hypothetical protein ACOC78_02850 [Actinomycetota bacterium]
MIGIADTGTGIGIVNTAERDTPPNAPYFLLEFEQTGGEKELVFAAGVCSEAEGDEEIDARRYVTTLLQEFFKKKGAEIDIEDYGVMLRRIFQHIHRHLYEEWEERVGGLDLAVVLAEASTVHAARCGGGQIFVFHGGEASPIFGDEEDSSLLGTGSWKKVGVKKAAVQPGDILVICSPEVAGVIKERDLTLILRRASDPPKAGLFLSAIAERKGAQGPLTALIWEVPNYQGAAILTEETAPGAEKEQEEEGQETEVADQAKKHWLNLWRHRKG